MALRDPNAAPAPIEITPPTVQFTTRGEPTLVRFQRRSSRDGLWKTEEFHPTQTELAAFESVVHPGTTDGYWGDAGVEAAAIAYMRDEYGITNVEIVGGGAR